VGYIFAAGSVGLSSFRYLWWAPKTHVFWNRVCSSRSRSSKVVDFGTSRKRVCDFLSVINSNLGRILPCFEDIAGFHPNFGGVPLGLDCRYWGSDERRPEAIIRIDTFELIKPIRPRYINVTDGQTEWRTTYCSNTGRSLFDEVMKPGVLICHIITCLYVEHIG